ncbi:MAG TPA: hypothetical protein VER76_04880 [Pyrinomonadaceae bacterium]|nr:hypothetical protein [Pyrinomonadaceae bacterium]
MNITPEALADLFRQLAFISALIGGFAFAFLGVLLTAPSRSRVVEWTAGMAMGTVASLLVCVIGWTLMSSQLVTPKTSAAIVESFSFPAVMNRLHPRLSLLFIIGTFLFLASLGLSGWIRSRTLGIVSTVIALLAAVGFMLVMTPFLR